MRPPPSAPWSALALAAALALPPGRAPAEPTAPPAVPIKDHRELKRYKREIADDRHDLARLRSRLDRLDALRAARTLDVRAVEELDRRVHDEMVKEARERRLEVHPRLGEAARRSSQAPTGGGQPLRFFTAADEARVDQITLEWAASRGKTARADLDRRRVLLAELAELTRVELEDDLRAFVEMGGDPGSIPAGEGEVQEPPGRPTAPVRPKGE
jgi:hypothetical protein